MKNMAAAASLLLTLFLASPSQAQDDLPYHQAQRLVVIFKVNEKISVRQFNGNPVEVLDVGLYRFDARVRSQSVLTPANFQDGSGPFVRYAGGLSGRIRELAPFGTRRDARMRLKLTDVDFSARNLIRAADLELEFRVQLSSMSSTVSRLKGSIAHNGASHVVGNLANSFSSSPGKIEVYHAKFTIENHLPRKQALETFPAKLSATVRPTPKDEIEAGPYSFDLERASQTDLGVVNYDSSARFPMVEESDYYGHYRSSPNDLQVVLREDGRVWIQFGWGLGGRYHGWNNEYTVNLSAAQYRRLLRDGRLTVTGTAEYHYGGEDDVFDVETSAEIELVVTAPAGASASPASGSSSGLVGGLSTN